MNRLLLLLAVMSALAISAFAGSVALPASSHPDLTLLMIGQSNMDGSNQLPPSPLLLAGAREHSIAWCYYKDRTWGLLQDPYAGGESYYEHFKNVSAGASIAPGLARRLMPTAGNLAVIPMAKAGTTIGAWMYTPAGGMSYLDKCVDQVRASGQTPGLALWWQGESNSQTLADSNKAAYNGYLGQIANRFYAEFGCETMVAVMQSISPTQYPYQAAVQQAQRDAPAEVPHVLAGPDLSDITTMPHDPVHIIVASKIDLAASRWAVPVLAWKAGQ